MSWEWDQVGKAQAVAGHQEESTGHVCRKDCTGCNDPVGQLVRELEKLRGRLWSYQKDAGRECTCDGAMATCPVHGGSLSG